MLTISKPCAAESQAYQVEGFAPTSPPARRLNEAGVHAATLQSFLAGGSNSDAYEQQHFYFVDESSLVRSVLVQRQDMTGADRWASRGLPRSLPQRNLLMTTHLFDNECDRSDLGVLCAVQHELVATVDHNANGISELEIAAFASSRQPQTGCPVTARAALHNTSPVRANEVF